MSEINVTPFVDVMLVLLIIFMVTAPLLVAGVPVDLPDSKAKALKSDDALILATDPDREGEAISWHLQEALASSLKKGKTVSIGFTKSRIFLRLSSSTVAEASA